MKIFDNVTEIVRDDMEALCRNSIDLIQYARGIAARQVNLVQLMTFYSLGRWIVEEQQHGEQRARYGQKVIRGLSEALTKEFGRGFSVDTLENARKIYLTYGDRISETVFRKFAIEKPNRRSGFWESLLTTRKMRFSYGEKDSLTSPYGL